MLNVVDGYVVGDTRTRAQMYGVLRGPRGEHSQTEATASTCSKQGIKTATGNLTDTLLVQHMNEGRHERNGKGVTLMSIMLAELPW